MQTSESSCGPASMSNALKALGFDVDEGACVRWLDRVRRKNNLADGTTESLVSRALAESPRSFGIQARLLVHADPATAVYSLRGLLVRGVGILAVDQDEHWVTAIGLGPSGRFLVCDPAESELVLSYSPEQLLTRWEAAGPPATFTMVSVTSTKVR